jgi:hypothetical protein
MNLKNTIFGSTNVILNTLKYFSGSTQPAQTTSGGLFGAPQPVASRGFEEQQAPIQGTDTIKSGVQQNISTRHQVIFSLLFLTVFDLETIKVS